MLQHLILEVLILDNWVTHLLFDFKVSCEKSWLVNLSKRLQTKLQIRVAVETLYDCGGKSLFAVYKDLFKMEDERKNMIEYGVATENYRKLVSRDDSASIDANDQATLGAVIYNIFSKNKECV